MSGYIVRKRYGGEPLDITQFVRLHDPLVDQIMANLRHDALSCWDWVCRNIVYPTGEFPDRHVLHAFTKRGLFGESSLLTFVDMDLWHFPNETLFMGVGDCEDSSILLCAMLRHFLSPAEVYTAVGTYEGLGHSWVVTLLGGIPYVLEATRKRARPSLTQDPEGYPYDAALWFNDVNVIELKEIPPWLLMHRQPGVVEVTTQPLSVEQQRVKARLLEAFFRGT